MNSNALILVCAAILATWPGSPARTAFAQADVDHADAGETASIPADAMDPAGRPTAKPGEKQGKIYVIPIDGPIEAALLYILRRGVTEAEETGAQAIVFKMYTPGGTLDAARKIVNLVENISVPTYTFVEEEAFSAGAIIAMATRHIYMAPGSVIGDAMPILATGEEMGENQQEKMVSATAALMRSAAEQGGHDPKLGEAMVRRELEYTIGDEVICKEGALLTLTDREAARMNEETGKPLLSAGTMANVDAMLEHVGLGNAEVVHLQVTSVEKIARFIKAISPFLLMVGILGLYIEIKTPGLGIAGLIGVVSLAVFFWGHHIAGLAGAEELLLIVLGIAFLAAEIFVIPGFGVLGVLGLLMILTGLLLTMVEHYPGGSLVVDWAMFEGPLLVLSTAFVGATFGAIVASRYLPQSRLFRPLRLETEMKAAEGYVSSSSTKELVGLLGTTLTPLRPSGSARVGDRKIDAITTGQFLESGRDIRVVESHGSRVIVEPVAGDNDPNPEGGS